MSAEFFVLNVVVVFLKRIKKKKRAAHPRCSNDVPTSRTSAWLGGG